MSAPTDGGAGPGGWTPDEAPGPGLEGTDAYGAWLLGHGADFSPSLEEIAEDEADFTTRLALMPPGSEPLVRVLRAGEAVPEGAELVAPAPLRARSLPGSTSSAPLYVPPEGLDVGRVVVVGVIDDTINLAHERLRHGEGTRIDAAWVQDGAAADGSPVPFGRAWTREEIEAELGRDEVGAMRALGLGAGPHGIAPPPRAATHGTHITDLAAGASPNDADALHRRVVAVGVPSAVTADTSGTQLGGFVVAALDFVLARARAMGEALGCKPPVAVNLSYGLSGHPHPAVARAIDALLDGHREKGGGPVELLVPSGNQNLDRIHATAEADRSGAAVLDVPWMLPPGDRTASFLEVWLPEGCEGIELEVARPGEGLDAVPVDPPSVLRGPRGTVIARASMERFDGGRRVLLALAPTEVPRADREAAPCGEWRVRLRAKGLAADGRIEAWIRRDDGSFGHRARGRQSYFDHAGYRRHDARGDLLDVDPSGNAGSPVRRSGTMNGLAGTRAVVVGGYEAASWPPRASLYAATGTRERGPDIAAPSARTRIRAGVIGAGHLGGSRVGLGGTSAATALATRALAEAMEREGRNASFHGRAALRAMAEENERRLAGEGVEPLPAIRSGAGRIASDAARERVGG